MNESESRVNNLSPTIAPLVESGGVSIRRTFDRLAAAEFRFVQLSSTLTEFRPRELDRSARRDIQATLKRRELNMSGIDHWIPVAHFGEPDRVDRAVQLTKEAIELAADLGRCVVSLVLPEDATVVEELILCANQHGVEIADHAIPPCEREAVGVGIDPAAWMSQGKDPTQAIHQYSARVRVVRLCDLSQAGMRIAAMNASDGRLDITEYKVAVSVSSYCRPVVIDARQWIDPWNGIEATRKAWLEV